MSERARLTLLLLVYLGVGSAFALLTPDWQVPDEPAHFNYVRQVSTHRGCCPIIEVGDWDQNAMWDLIGEGFPPGSDLSAFQYEDHQPPLYYQLASLIYNLGHDEAVQLKLLRLLSVIYGAGVVYCAYALGKAVVPDRPGVALGAAAFVAFLPQHVAMMAGVNNDSLAELLIAITLLATVYYVLGLVKENQRLGQLLASIMLLLLTVLLIVHRVPIMVGVVFLALIALGAWSYLDNPAGDWPLWGIGILLGLIFATKVTGYWLALLIPLALLLRAWPIKDWRAFRRQLVFVLVPALLLGGLWWLRNIGIYGFPDFLGLGAHNLVVADQPRTAAQIAQMGFGPYLSESLQLTFDSFWGQFGWMTLPLQDGMYRVLLALTLVAFGGLFVDAVLLHPRAQIERRPHMRTAWALLWLAIGLTLLAYVYYNTEFLQRQGRYLFPALIPIGIFIALGLDAWRRLVLSRMAALQWLVPLFIGLLAPLDLYLLLRVIRPLL